MESFVLIVFSVMFFSMLLYFHAFHLHLFRTMIKFAVIFISFKKLKIMKKKKQISLAMLVMLLTTLSINAHVSASVSNSLQVVGSTQIGPQLLTLQVRYIDPNDPEDDPHRTPTETPEVTQDDHTLSFDASCHGCTLRLVNADNEVEYTTVITSSTLVLPSTLDGTYELQIIQGEWCFYGDIEL